MGSIYAQAYARWREIWPYVDVTTKDHLFDAPFDAEECFNDQLLWFPSSSFDAVRYPRLRYPACLLAAIFASIGSFSST